MLEKIMYTTTVGDLMTAQVMTVGPHDTMSVVEDILKRFNIHHVPVVDTNGFLKGMISRTDYNRVLSSFMLFNKKRNEELSRRTLESLEAQDVMTKQVATLMPDDTLLLAVGMFKENRFHAIPVVDKEKKLLGILTTFDLLLFAYPEPSMTATKEQ